MNMTTNQALRMLQDRIAQLECRVSRLLIPCAVHSVQADPYMAICDFAAQGEEPQLTAALPVLMPRAGAATAAHLPVQPGERGLILAPTGVVDAGFYLPAAFCSARQNPVDADDRAVRAQLKHGSVSLTADSAAATLAAVAPGSARITCGQCVIQINEAQRQISIAAPAGFTVTSTATTINGPVQINGALTVSGAASFGGGGSVTGNLSATGAITAQGEITGSDLKTPSKQTGYNAHTHTGDSGGSTSAPIG